MYPDGFPAKLETYLWTSACGETGINDVNGADDPYVVFHEYTHGMSLRLVTDSAGVGALNDAQAGGHGRGLERLVRRGLPGGRRLPERHRRPGGASSRPLPGRRRPAHAALRLPGGPGRRAPARGPAARARAGTPTPTSAASSDEPEVHADGEIWAETLWDLRRALVAKHPADGVTRARALITDGMRLSPPEPSFLEGRDAILKSDVARGYGDRDLIWAVFAARGMGLNATTTGGTDTAPVAGFTAPPPQPVRPAGRKRVAAPRHGGAPRVRLRGHEPVVPRGLEQDAEVGGPSGGRGHALSLQALGAGRRDDRPVPGAGRAPGEGKLPAAHTRASPARALHPLGVRRAAGSLRPAPRRRVGALQWAARQPGAGARGLPGRAHRARRRRKPVPGGVHAVHHRAPAPLRGRVGSRRAPRGSRERRSGRRGGGDAGFGHRPGGAHRRLHTARGLRAPGRDARRLVGRGDLVHRRALRAPGARALQLPHGEGGPVRSRGGRAR